MANITDYIRGDSRILEIPVTKSDGVTAVDLTGATVYFTVNSNNAPTDDSGAAFPTKTATFTVPVGVDSSSGFTVGANTASAGIAWIVINPSDTTGVAPGNYFYDIQLKDASGNISSIKQAKFTINADITRSTA